ncbi:hypothetical protein HMPREF1624_01614 [Sporothrix schenckii ATCC 58251]|uniref:D-arabinono-1,4-lactone oxidase n=1 Tax=Sporothrix schenckii (strain ATCC 58251 / de Perez 2211183) TaxID=1391915 RepID=U7Q8B2_SPOS1|nr:hypothetical protein HMPREF1624_01614 [Sporothrix schenckii ATCC 58251]
MGNQHSVERQLRHARGKPVNEKTLKELDKVFCQNPENAHDGVWNVVRDPGVEHRRRGRDAKQRYVQARQAVHLSLAASHGHLIGSSEAKNGHKIASNDQAADKPTWVNCVGEQANRPLVIVKPESLQQLVAVLADAHSLQQRVRAVGSGHSFSDITYSTDAMLVDMTLLKRVAMVDNGEEGIVSTTKPVQVKANKAERGVPGPAGDALLTASNRSRNLARVQAGVTIRELNEELDNRGLALPNMGAFDGQTVAGVMSTGTHGSGIGFGPMCSLVRAIVLVVADGTVYQIEPASSHVGKGPLSDPAAFPRTIDGLPVVLRQDNDWFRTALVSMGCVGVIYSYVIDVTEAFHVRELRSATRWDDVRKELLPELWTPVAPAVAVAHHFELVLNPYMWWSHNSCVRVERNRVTAETQPSGARKDWLSTLLEQFGIHSIPHLLGVLKRFPAISPIAINRAIATLVESGPYVDKSFRVFNLGPANSIKAMAIELHCDAKQCVPVIDKLLDVFRDEAKRHEYYMTGPLGIRFIGASDAFLAPQAGRMTCAIELDMLVGVETGAKLAQDIKERMCTDSIDSPRLHWGLDIDLVTDDDVRSWYPDFEAWHTVYRQLNSTGMFNNKFTDRLGISIL